MRIRSGESGQFVRMQTFGRKALRAVGFGHAYGVREGEEGASLPSEPSIRNTGFVNHGGHGTLSASAMAGSRSLAFARIHMTTFDSAPSIALRYRFATDHDAATVADLVESGYRGERSRAGWTTEADLLGGQRTDVQSVIELIRTPESHVLLAERMDTEACEPLACAQLDKKADYAYFGMFSVRPGLQNGGIGRAVLAEAERIAREVWGLPEVRMSVIVQREELIAWYLRRGYARTGESLAFPYGDARFGVPKRDDLRFEVLKKRF